MAAEPSFKKTNVVKILIESFTDRRFTGKSETFSLPINPESYSQNFKINYDSKTPIGSSGSDGRFTSTAPEELKLDFYFDGTETVEGYAQDGSVAAQLKEFKRIVYDMDGKIHRPRFIKIHWTDFTFPCILINLDINYTLFDSEGNPLRVKLSATFLNFIEQYARDNIEKKNSPDLTHRRQVTQSDRLDLMTFNIYDNSKFVVNVAKANNLSSIRNIKVGTILYFPPFDKTEK
jgi:Contractile injection system tube protein